MYYRLEGNSSMLTTYVEAVNETDESMISGHLIDEEDEDLPYIFTYHDPVGNPLPDFFQGDDIMSKKMLNVFNKCGVDNIQVFPLKFINKVTGEERDDYVVFNIIGLVSCANMEESDALPLGDGHYFQNLVINPEATRDLDVFRVLESLMDIIVNEKIAHKLQEEGIRGILLTPTTKE